PAAARGLGLGPRRRGLAHELGAGLDPALHRGQLAPRPPRRWLLRRDRGPALGPLRLRRPAAHAAPAARPGDRPAGLKSVGARPGWAALLASGGESPLRSWSGTRSAAWAARCSAAARRSSPRAWTGRPT